MMMHYILSGITSSKHFLHRMPFKTVINCQHNFDIQSIQSWSHSYKSYIFIRYSQFRVFVWFLHVLGRVGTFCESQVDRAFESSARGIEPFPTIFVQMQEKIFYIKISKIPEHVWDESLEILRSDDSVI